MKKKQVSTKAPVKKVVTKTVAKKIEKKEVDVISLPVLREVIQTKIDIIKSRIEGIEKDKFTDAKIQLQNLRFNEGKIYALLEVLEIGDNG